MTTKEKIGSWFDDGLKHKAMYMIVACDTFDYSDYAVYAYDDAACLLEYKKLHHAEMSKVMEVYDLRLDKAKQLAENIAMHLPTRHVAVVLEDVQARPPTLQEMGVVSGQVRPGTALGGAGAVWMSQAAQREIEDLQKEVAKLKAAALVPGVMHCAKCKFQLNRVTLYMGNGTVGPGNNDTEPCPNGCGPLWPVTWEQEARDCWKTAENQFEIAQTWKEQVKALTETAPQGSWLWAKLMDWCAKRGFAPAEFSDLFAICREAYEQYPMWRHKKTHGVYTEVGRAKLQTHESAADMQDCVVYRGQDGVIWVRPVPEFEDGRFERL